MKKTPLYSEYKITWWKIQLQTEILSTKSQWAKLKIPSWLKSVIFSPVSIFTLIIA